MMVDIAHEWGHARVLQELRVPCRIVWSEPDSVPCVEADLIASDDTRLQMAQIAAAGPAAALGYRFERAGTWPDRVTMADLRTDPTASAIDLASIDAAPPGSNKALCWAITIGLAAGRDCARNPEAVADIVELVIHQRKPLEVLPMPEVVE